MPAPKSAKTIARKISVFKDAARAAFGDLPEAVQLIALQDEFTRTRKPSRGLSFAEVYRNTRKDIKIGFFGGTNLEVGMPKDHRVYYQLNARLMPQFARAILPQQGRVERVGWSVATGAGRGVAMHGPMKCLAEVRSEVEFCNSKCIGIPSGLLDEPVNDHIDWSYSTRPQNNITLREEMIIAMASDGVIVYPGNKGTLGELFWTDLINYVSGRVKGNLPLRPVILVDLMDNPALGRSFHGGSFFAPIRMQWENAARHRLSKSVADSVHFVNAESPMVEFDIMQILTGHLVQTGRLPKTD